MHNMKFTILAIFKYTVKYIHIVVQPLLPSISRTLNFFILAKLKFYTHWTVSPYFPFLQLLETTILLCLYNFDYFRYLM